MATCEEGLAGKAKKPFSEPPRFPLKCQDEVVHFSIQLFAHTVLLKENRTQFTEKLQIVCSSARSHIHVWGVGTSPGSLSTEPKPSCARETEFYGLFTKTMTVCQKLFEFIFLRFGHTDESLIFPHWLDCAAQSLIISNCPISFAEKFPDIRGDSEWRGMW